MIPLLYQRFPTLTAPRLAIGAWPSPCYPRDAPGLPTGALWCKDERDVSALCGGNKVRKLELLLAEAQADGATDLLTAGALGSHHVLATALHGAAVGLRTHAVLVPQPITAHVAAQLAASEAAAASVERVSSAALAPDGAERIWSRVRAETGRPPTWIPVGGSGPAGVAGEISLGMEIALDIALGRLPGSTRVVLPLGSGGTAAGILVGLRLAGCAAEVVAVRVVDRPFGTARGVRRLARMALAWLSRRGADVPDDSLDGLRIREDWRAGGYGIADDETARVLALGPALGLPLEATYTAKALGAALDEAQRAPTLFVYTLPRVTGRNIHSQTM